jgi:hypothetical protein
MRNKPIREVPSQRRHNHAPPGGGDCRAGLQMSNNKESLMLALSPRNAPRCQEFQPLFDPSVCQGTPNWLQSFT